MKKKAIITFLALSMACLCACGQKNDVTTETSDAPVTESADSSSDMISADASSDAKEESADAKETGESKADDANEENQNNDDAENKAQEEASLNEILLNVKNTLQIGTAGSSLSAVAPTIALMEWADDTSLSASDVQTVTEKFAGDLSEAELEEFYYQLEAIGSTYNSLLDENSRKGLLSDAGEDEPDIDFNNPPTDIINAIINAVELNPL